MNFFNAQGQLNASDMKDAFAKIMRYASMMEENMPSGASLVGQPSFNDTKRDELINKAMFTQEGKITLAQAMANPIRRNLDYQGIFRRTLVLDPLPQGALPVYDRDIDVAAVVISSNGAAPESQVYSERISVPYLELVCNPTVRIREVRTRRFNIIDRAVQKARQELMAMEDANGFAALNVAAQIENTPVSLTAAGLTKKDLSQIKRSIDHWDLITSKFFMNINEFTDILNWSAFGGASVGEIDPVTQREILQTGIYAHIWGADILVSKIVPAGTVYGCADPEFVGVMPIMQDVEVLPCDEPRLLKLGWVVNEIVGIGIVNPRATAMGSKAS